MNPKRRHMFVSPAVCEGECLECRVYEQVLPMAFLIGVLGYLIYFITLSPPLYFPAGTYVRITQGQTLQQVGKDLKNRHLIRSVRIFDELVKLVGNDKKIYAGEYFFPGKENVWTIAQRIAFGDYEVTPVRMTFYEGLTAQQMANQLAAKVPDFDADVFVALGKPKEGYLFPDTYFVMPGEEPQLLLRAMENNFNSHIAAASTTIAKFGKPISQIIVMASLLEREAPTKHDRQIIAGMLWRRIQLGMPLQVDAVFPYILNKPGTELTHDDLKVDSPYNTYTNKGLPPAPIANPGMASILAAVTPIKTNYLYYMSDKQGNFHYCATYACHVANVARYYP